MNNLKIMTQLHRIFGKLLNKDSSGPILRYDCHIRVQEQFSLTFAINGGSMWKVIFAEDQMRLLQTKKSKQNWRMEILLCVRAATPAQHVSILLCLLDLLYWNSLTPYFYHLWETQQND